MSSSLESINGDTRVVTCELCIVGAGIAGLNALFAASQHLSSRDKIVIVDSAPQAGGMWLSTYEYVRLHQPHPMFTVGNLAWEPPTDPSYLATRHEVLAHLQSCLAALRKRVSLEEYFGYAYESHDEVTNGAREVLVKCAPVAPGAKPLLIKAKKFIKAIATNIKPKEPLPLSSGQVRSLSPNRHDLFGDEVQKSDAPIYIVGGGKTGMDTAHALITRFPRKKVRLLIGAGTLFTNRDKAFPVGLRRWTIPTTTLEAFLDLARRFDGTNEEAVLEHFRSNYALGLDAKCRRFMYGTLSIGENQTISKGVDEVIKELPLYEVDFPEMSSKAKEAFIAISTTHLLYNAGAIVAAAPTRVMNECGLDLERWYPMPRRLLAVWRFMRFQKNNPDHYRRNLDKVRERFGVRCGPLPYIRA